MFTEDTLKAGKGLHVELKQSEIERVAGVTHWTVAVSRVARAKDELRSFWLRHGEDVLAALEEARAEVDILQRQWNQFTETYGSAAAFDIALRAAEEG